MPETRRRRLRAVDALRGLLVVLMVFVDECGDAHRAWVGHAAWDGLHLADLVVPGFLVLVGASLALDRARALGPRLARGARLVALGLALQGAERGFEAEREGEPPFGYNLRTLRLCGVLNRIGVAYAAAAMVELAVPDIGASARRGEAGQQEGLSAALLGTPGQQEGPSAALLGTPGQQEGPSAALLGTPPAAAPAAHWTAATGRAASDPPTLPGSCGALRLHLSVARREGWRIAVYGALLACGVVTTYLAPVPSWTTNWGAVVSCEGARGAVGDPGCAAGPWLDRALLGPRRLHGPWFAVGMPQCSSCAPDVCPRADAAPWCFAQTYDPEGVLSTLQSMGSVALGVHCGKLLLLLHEPQRPAALDAQVRVALATLGAALLAAGLALHLSAAVPINKQLYSPSFTLATGGLGAAALAALLWALDGDQVVAAAERELLGGLHGRVTSSRGRGGWRQVAARGGAASSALVCSLGNNALLVFALHGPLEAGLDLVYWSDEASQFPRLDLLTLVRRYVCGGNAVVFATFKVAMFACVVASCERYGVRLQV